MLSLITVGPRLAVGALRATGSVLSGLADGIDLLLGSRGASVRVEAMADDSFASAARATGSAAPAAGAGVSYRGADSGVVRVRPAAPVRRRQAPPPLPDLEAERAPTERIDEERAASVSGAAGEAARVSEEPVLVEEVADAGAENGAGPEIRVDEPWPGYAKMRGEQITSRLAAADDAAIAVVALYERAHRARRTVLGAAERELRRRRSAPAGGRGRAPRSHRPA